MPDFNTTLLPQGLVAAGFTEKGGPRNAPRWIAWYCLSEILRAGAVETGFVEDDEQLPTAVKVDEYREVLREEALRIVTTTETLLPWYLILSQPLTVHEELQRAGMNAPFRCEPAWRALHPHAEFGQARCIGGGFRQAGRRADNRTR